MGKSVVTALFAQSKLTKSPSIREKCLRLAVLIVTDLGTHTKWIHEHREWLKVQVNEAYLLDVSQTMKQQLFQVLQDTVNK